LNAERLRVAIEANWRPEASNAQTAPRPTAWSATPWVRARWFNDYYNGFGPGWGFGGGYGYMAAIYGGWGMGRPS